MDTENSHLDPTHPDPTQARTTPSSPPQATTPSFLANNLLFAIKHNADRCCWDSLKKIVNTHFKPEDIQVAFALSKDFIPEDLTAKRSCRLSNAHEQLNVLLTWFTTATNFPQIFADDPYSLPPEDLKDLGIVTVYNTARKAMELSNENDEMLREELSVVNTQLHELSEVFRLELAKINTLIQGLSPPPSTQVGVSPSVSVKGPTSSPPTHPPSGEGVSITPRPRKQTTTEAIPPQLGAISHPGNVWVTSHTPTPPPTRDDTPPPECREASALYANTISASPPPTPHPLPNQGDNDDGALPDSGLPEVGGGEEGRGWERNGHSRRDRRRHRWTQRRQENNRRNADTPHPAPIEGGTDQQKRCHRVIYNLRHSVSLDYIKRFVKHLTGEDPLIAQQLPCKARGKTAFRITCPLQHAQKLTGESFGHHVKVSRYNFRRDFPVGNLKEIPQVVTQHQSHASPARNDIRTTPHQGGYTSTTSPIGRFIQDLRP